MYACVLSLCILVSHVQRIHICVHSYVCMNVDTMVVMITVYAGVSAWMCACVAGYVLVCISADLIFNCFLCKMFPPVMMEILICIINYYYYYINIGFVRSCYLLI